MSFTCYRENVVTGQNTEKTFLISQPSATSNWRSGKEIIPRKSGSTPALAARTSIAISPSRSTKFSIPSSIMDLIATRLVPCETAIR
jgi:hypothetical protein